MICNWQFYAIFFNSYCFNFTLGCYLLSHSGLHMGLSWDFIYNSYRCGTPQVSSKSLLQVAHNSSFRGLAALLNSGISVHDVRFKELFTNARHTFYFSNFNDFMLAFNKSSFKGTLSDYTLQSNNGEIFLNSHDKLIIIEAPIIMASDILNNVTLSPPSYVYPINGDSINILNQLLFHQP